MTLSCSEGEQGFRIHTLSSVTISLPSAPVSGMSWDFPLLPLERAELEEKQSAAVVGGKQGEHTGTGGVGSGKTALAPTELCLWMSNSLAVLRELSLCSSQVPGPWCARISSLGDVSSLSCENECAGPGMGQAEQVLCPAKDFCPMSLSG